MRKQAELMAAQGYLTIPRVVEFLGVSRSTVYTLCKAGKLRTIQVGAHKYVECASLVDHVGEKAAKLLGIVVPKKSLMSRATRAQQ